MSSVMALKRYPSASGMTFGKIGARRMMHRGPVLPPGARWVEYLESTGTQYVDTGITFSSNMRFKINHIPVGNILDNYFTGHYAVHNKIFACGFYQSKCIYGIGDLQENPITAIVGNRYECDLTYSSNLSANTSNISGHINGQTISLSSTALYNVYTRKVFAFARNNGGTVGNFLNCQLFSFSLYSNNILVRDFRPIAIGNTGYMLDLISGEYLPYGNKGTGNFVIGPDAPPPTI